MHNISGSVLRAVADWYDTQDFVNTATMSELLRADAQRLDEREAEEKRIDELAEVYHNARQLEMFGRVITEFHHIANDSLRSHRNAVRAVLDALAEDRDTALINNRRVQREPRQWNSIRDVPPGVMVKDNAGDMWRWDDRQLTIKYRAPGVAFRPWTVTVDGAEDYAPFIEVVDGAQ